MFGATLRGARRPSWKRQWAVEHEGRCGEGSPLRGEALTGCASGVARGVSRYWEVVSCLCRRHRQEASGLSWLWQPESHEALTAAHGTQPAADGTQPAAVETDMEAFAPEPEPVAAGSVPYAADMGATAPKREPFVAGCVQCAAGSVRYAAQPGATAAELRPVAAGIR